MEDGSTVQGTVTELIGAKGGNTYRYSYAYPVGGSTLTTSNRSIPTAARDESRPGTIIQVRYDPAKPERSMTAAELEDLESWPDRIIFPVVAILLLAAGVMRIRSLRPRVRPPAPPRPPRASARIPRDSR
jgi:hypothetical protein